MRTLAVFLPVVLFASNTVADQRSTAVLLAQSCVGEAGFESIDTGECAAILHIYRKRSEVLGWPIEKVVRRYSAAVKERGDHPNSWVLHLNDGGGKPHRWSSRLRWEYHRDRWMAVLNYARAFLRGEVDDPLPQAVHYGGRMDRHRLSMRVWTIIRDTGFLNTFYARR